MAKWHDHDKEEAGEQIQVLLRRKSTRQANARAYATFT